MEARYLVARVNKKDIAYVSHTIESYEGLGVVTTADPDQGLIRITVSPFFVEEVKKILAGMKKEVGLKLLDGNSG